MPTIPARTFFVAACIVIGIALTPYLSSLLDLPRPSEEPTISVLQEALPEAEMAELAEGWADGAAESDPAEEAAASEAVENQSENELAEEQDSELATDTEQVDSKRPPVASSDAAEITATDNQEELLAQLEAEEANELGKEQPLSSEQLPESKRNDFSELVEDGNSLKRTLEKQGVKSPAYKAKMAADVIDSLRRSGFIRIAVTDGASFYLFTGSLSQPGEPVYAMKRDWRGWSERGMALERSAARELLKLGRSKFPGRGARCQAVLVLRADIDSMVLGAQGRAAAAKGTSLDKIKSTSGHFSFYKGMPFNYSITEITDSSGRRIPVTGKSVMRKG